MQEIKTIPIEDVKTLLEQGYEVEVDSPNGWTEITDYVDKGIWDEYILCMENGKVVRCNENHLFLSTIGWVSAKELALYHDVHLLTETGPEKILSCDKSGVKIPIVDIQVAHKSHAYYTNGIVSHNTGVGKTLAMCHMASANLMDNRNVLYITAEMAEERIAERIDANLLNVNVGDIKTLSAESFNKRINSIIGKTKGKLIIKEYPTATASTGNFRSLLNELALKKDFRPDIIYVDYLNICASYRVKLGRSSSYEYIKAIAEELRGLAVEKSVPIVTATQLNRSGSVNSDPGLEDTAESFGLPATADFMIAAVTNDDLEALDHIMWKQLKNRYKDKKFYKRFVTGVDLAKMSLYDVEQPVASDDNDDDIPVFDNTPFGSQRITKPDLSLLKS